MYQNHGTHHYSVARNEIYPTGNFESCEQLKQNRRGFDNHEEEQIFHQEMVANSKANAQRGMILLKSLIMVWFRFGQIQAESLFDSVEKLKMVGKLNICHGEVPESLQMRLSNVFLNFHKAVKLDL